MRLFSTISILSIFVLSCNTGKSVISNEKKISIEVLKKMENVELYNRIDCDSIETTLGYLVCANVELQRQDSILKKIELEIINEFKKNKDSLSLSKFLYTSDLWEKYRYSHCEECIINNHRVDRIQFLKCAIELTKNRILILKNKCSYY